MATTFKGKDGVNTFVAISLKHGLRMYDQFRMQPNRQWTPTRMLAKASEITGHPYKRGQYAKAAADLDAWITANGTTGG